MRHEVLDDAAALAEADPGGMLGKTATFAGQMEAALDLPADLAGAPPRRLILGGMGGSAAAGRCLAPLLEDASGFRLLIADGYRLPALLPGDLLILSSYSGQTEETLELFEEGRRLGARRMVLSSGGELTRRAEAENLPRLSLPEGFPPRAAIPSSLGRLMALLRAWRLPPFEKLDNSTLIADLAKTAELCNPQLPAEENPAKEAALTLGRKRPAAVALSPAYRGAAQRLKTQCEENASRSAQAFELPELHHNSWVAWMEDDDPPGVPLWLGAADAHPRVLERKRLSEKALSDRSIPFYEIPSEGDSTLNRVLTSVLLGDFISVYLALLGGADPSQTNPLDAMKAQLA